MPHPALWPALVGAALGLPLAIVAAWLLVRRWRRMAGPARAIGLVAVGLFEAAYLLNVYAWLIEPKMLAVRRVTIASAEWHGALITIAALADTHAGSPHVTAARIADIVTVVNGLGPDLVVLLGDYAGSHEPEAVRTAEGRSEVLGGIAAFAGLRAPYGVVGIIGNHDSWYGRATIAEALTAAGVTVLWNDSVLIPRADGDLVVAGIADDDTGDPDFAAALRGADGRDTIVLSHSPDPFAEMPPGPALMLAGHSHCGQVTIPFLGRPILPIHNPAYACGLVEEDGKTMYVSAGIGTSILPVRFLNPPEVVLVTLTGVE